MATQFPQLPPVNVILDRVSIDLAPDNSKTREVAAKRLLSPEQPQKRPRSFSENDKFTIHRKKVDHFFPAHKSHDSEAHNAAYRALRYCKYDDATSDEESSQDDSFHIPQ